MGAPRARLSPHRRVMRGSWISLFAMLMIFIGPLISQAMPMDHHAGMSMDMPACHGEPKPTKTPDEHHVLWEKCGYCSLLFSCPALPGSVSFVTLGTPPPANALIPAPRLGHARQSIFPGARSRAPPIVS
ncbi:MULTISPECIES: DUF2946 domain-containing protein [Pseudomonas fluorescens group]|uniref:DUF2946 domain-containing protein n=1 Tax=Pseudomonas synxantha TaxID=47883 RepID=A0A5D3GDE6_9PSED|nr:MULTISPECIES: DUF2946 domain-containing protein [Pseudomonas fluorescens group]MCK3829725.1 DUF2946 domain-containing protein [Pseudomonas fluorescens]TYK58180.1 DUF2946 domain-containing protein [Pseudomonas synxantha]